MGDNIEARKAYISENADFNKTDSVQFVKANKKAPKTNIGANSD